MQQIKYGKFRSELEKNKEKSLCKKLRGRYQF